MSSIHVDYRDRRPIYEQLVGNIRELILRGVLAADEQLPSVRSLAAELAINPNTIHKAYAELERCGLIYSSPGRGSFVTADSAQLRQARLREVESSLTDAMRAAKGAGLSRAEAEALIKEIWRDEC
ncbi:MAG: GntR family transcriptional regulator [Clostridia bacterium]|nr:GntR family transcriptional regulator [Clostridia bacterium]